MSDSYISLTDTNVTLETAFGQIPFTGVIGIKAVDPRIPGVMLLDYYESYLLAKYLTHNRLITSLTNLSNVVNKEFISSQGSRVRVGVDSGALQLRPIPYKAKYFTLQDVAYARSQYSGNCGCDPISDTEKIWSPRTGNDSILDVINTEQSIAPDRQWIPILYKLAADNADQDAIAAEETNNVVTYIDPSPDGSDDDYIDLSNIDYCNS